MIRLLPLSISLAVVAACTSPYAKEGAALTEVEYPPRPADYPIDIIEMNTSRDFLPVMHIYAYDRREWDNSVTFTTQDYAKLVEQMKKLAREKGGDAITHFKMAPVPDSANPTLKGEGRLVRWKSENVPVPATPFACPHCRKEMRWPGGGEGPYWCESCLTILCIVECAQCRTLNVLPWPGEFSCRNCGTKGAAVRCFHCREMRGASRYNGPHTCPLCKKKYYPVLCPHCGMPINNGQPLPTCVCPDCGKTVDVPKD